ncbi:MAG: SDR family NAD(P)-dependent oxidoreductase, partial [Promicromonosporaceae bacterium]|nr:SDR family NAD(P)-dependent oxidoreductase [Promicromonosporaceae bacterium]
DSGMTSKPAVLISGSAGGIGRATAEKFAREGWFVGVYDLDAAGAEQVAATLGAGSAIGGGLDVTRPEDWDRVLAAFTEATGGRLDLLINNAGGPFSGQFEETSDAEWQAAFALNFYGAVHGCRAVVPVMAQQGGGQIVNVISGIAYLPLAYQARYTATKAALHALTQVLRYEYWDLGIKVNSATPGTTKTGIWTEVPPPDYAQTAAESAEHILTGVERNESLIFGDTTDREKYELISNPATSAEGEAWFLDVARKRRAGESGF